MKVLTFLLITSVILSSCHMEKENDSPINQGNEYSDNFNSLNVSDNFDFQTVKKVTMSFDHAYESKNIPIQIYVDEPFNEDKLLGNSILIKDKSFQNSFAIDKNAKNIYVVANTIGIPNVFKFELKDNSNFFTLKNENAYNYDAPESSNDRVNYSGELHATFGGWDALGVPNYLTDSDIVSQDLIDDINASLPERRPVPTYHPDYLTDDNYDSKVVESAEIWITFIHEGAAWRNVLGYYTYDTSSPPATTEDIDSIKIVFPNLSFLHSGGGLVVGNKISLGNFDANTSIGWVLIPNGWNSGTPILKSQMKYSNPDFNTYAGADYRQYLVALKDTVRNKIILGFEDTTRPGGDNDFNDCMFYLTSTPLDAIDTDDLNPIAEAVDTDGDGLFDHEEDYPNDPERAFATYLQSQSDYFNYGFEDLWPRKGDYDFNDLVIGVNYQKVYNASYYVKDIIMDMKLYCIGGIYHNGFGIEFPFNASIVTSTTGQTLDKGIVTTAANGTETGNTKASIIVFEDAYSLMSSVDHLVNVKPTDNYVAPHEFTVTLELSSNQLLSSSFEDLPNPFIFVDQERGREVHLPNYTPTELSDDGYYRNNDDNTSVAENIYFKTSDNYPWAITVVASEFDYPFEGIDIKNAYNYIDNWVESDAASYNDWYGSGSGYRNNNKIYQKP